MNSSIVPVAGAGAGFWLPPAASTAAAQTDGLFYFILYLSAFFFAAIIAATVYFAVAYRRRSPDQKTHPTEGNNTIEFVWSAIPTLLLLVIFAWGFVGWLNLTVPPDNAVEIRVTGQKWVWSFDYPRDGISADTITVPVGRPVKLTMSSVDVLHSFYVPAFRIKRDVLPNRYTVAWFEATQEGEFPILCTEYCGTGHSRMLSKVKVVSAAAYEAWIKAGGDQPVGPDGKPLPLTALGEKLFSSKGCAACHSVNGAAGIGPTMLGQWNTPQKIADGSEHVMDDNYTRESIVNPNAKVVAGFAPVMPTFKGRLSDTQINALIEYIKSLAKN